ncbi:MAG: hypothetical protein AAF191_20995, partial [Verrucomicrobiota bacterium]
MHQHETIRQMMVCRVLETLQRHAQAIQSVPVCRASCEELARELEQLPSLQQAMVSQVVSHQSRED